MPANPGAIGALSWAGFTDAQRTQFAKDFFSQAVHGNVLFNPANGLIGKQSRSGNEAERVMKPFIMRTDLREKIGDRIRFFVTYASGGPTVDPGVDLHAVARKTGYSSLEMGIKEHYLPFGETEIPTTDQTSYLQQYMQANKHVAEAVGQVWEIAAHIHLCGYKPTSGTLTHNCFRDRTNEPIDPTIKGWNLNPEHLTDYPYGTGVAGSQYRVLPGALTDEQSIGSSNTFTVAQLTKAYDRAQDPNVGIPPCDDGHYLLVMHPACYSQLLQDSAFKEIFITHNNSPAGKNNMLVTGEMGVWNKVRILVSPFITPGINNSGAVIPTVRRNVLVGGGGLLMGIGKIGAAPGESVEVYSESKNFGQQKTVTAHFWGGIRRTFWTDDRDEVNAGRYRTMLVPAYAPDTSVYT